MRDFSPFAYGPCILTRVERGHENSHEHPGEDDDQDKVPINNEISGGRFEGPVGQFGSVFGDVNLSPPKSPEEAAFRARYMAKMQEEWDAEEKRKEEEEKNAPMQEGCSVIFTLVFIAFVIFWLILVYHMVTSQGFRLP